MFITDMPCYNCAKRIINSGFIKEVYYLRPYRDNSGVGLLIAARILVYHYQIVNHIGKKYADSEAYNILSPQCLREN
jgi:deoxycytidylate deaminase